MFKSIVKTWFPLKVHVWGGLGSQIHAWFLFERIQKVFPGRRVSLVFHSAGVTRRLPEIQDFLSVDQWEFIDDFLVNTPKKFSKPKFKIRSGFKSVFLKRLHLVESVDSENEFERIRWFTLQTRGHYSRLLIPQGLANQILNRVSEKYPVQNVSMPTPAQYVALHLRLGDLLEIEDKSPTKKRDVRKIVSKVHSELMSSNLLVFSDSPKVASEWLEGFRFVTLANHDLQSHALKSMVSMVNSDVFIGTGSKISIWVAIFRTHVFPQKLSYLPSYLKPILENMVTNSNKSTNLKYYMSVDGGPE